MSARTSKRLRWILLISVAITVTLYHTPPWGPRLAYPLMLLSTLAHEMGHGLMGILVGGDFESFKMWSDGSGVARVTGYNGRIAAALVSAGGLCGPAVVAALFFALCNKDKWAKASLAAVGIALLVADLLLVRSFFGIFFVGALGALFLWVPLKGPQWASQFTLVFVAVQLALSVFSRADYLFTPVAETAGGSMPSDVAQMSNALFLPYWFWGALCGAFSIAVLFWGLRFFFKSSNKAA
ncbi:MAG: peptidase M50 [Myxococcales bacterium]|nr:peptidase M50 [Myxococcales bacterium]